MINTATALRFFFRVTLDRPSWGAPHPGAPAAQAAAGTLARGGGPSSRSGTRTRSEVQGGLEHLPMARA